MDQQLSRGLAAAESLPRWEFISLCAALMAVNALAIDIELRDGRPVGVHLDAFPNLRVGQYVHGQEVVDSAGAREADRRRTFAIKSKLFLCVGRRDPARGEIGQIGRGELRS